MIIPLSFQDKTVAILGLGRSGRSVSQGLLRAGAPILAWDDQESSRSLARRENIPLTDLNAIDWETVDNFIVSPGIPHHYPAPHPIVARAQLAGLEPISDIEVLCLSQPQATYVGITGTNGKSTTTTLIGHVLKENGLSPEVGGNLGIPVIDLQPLGAKGIYVLELSSYQLELTPHLHPKISVILNITPDHLERHGGMEGYIEAKKLIYKNATPQDVLIISVDDPHCCTLYDVLKKAGGVTLLPFSTCKILTLGISVKEGILHENGTPLTSLKPFDRLRGQHNWQNIAAAFGTLRSLGLEAEAILESVASFPGLVHRQQVVACHKNVTFVNDSKATNAEAVAKALLCYQDQPLYVLFGGRPKEGGITPLLPYFSSLSHAFLYGEAARAFALTLEGKVPCTLCQTLEEAVGLATTLALEEGRPDAVVLLSPACASFDQFPNFEIRGEVFCQRVHDLIGKKP